MACLGVSEGRGVLVVSVSRVRVAVILDVSVTSGEICSPAVSWFGEYSWGNDFWSKESDREVNVNSRKTDGHRPSLTWGIRKDYS